MRSRPVDLTAYFAAMDAIRLVSISYYAVLLEVPTPSVRQADLH